MSRSPISFGKVDVGLSTTLTPVDAKPEAETPFRILVLGDFSGRASRGAFEPTRLAARKPIHVDRDNFDQVMAKLGVVVRLVMAGAEAPSIDLKFAELDDFHPDRIVQQVEMFEALYGLRRRLENPATFAKAAQEVRSWMKVEAPAPPDTPAPESANLSPADMLDQLVGTAPTEGVGRSRDEVDWNAFLAKVVQPHLEPRADPQQADLIALVDDVTSGQMRSLLHHPALRAVEAAWRGLYFLVRRLDTDVNLRLYLLDVSKAELTADLGAGEDLSASGTYKLLVEQTVGMAGAVPWAVVAGDYTFSQRPADVQLLGRLAKLGSRAGAPFLAGASPSLLGCSSLAVTPDPKDWSEPADLEAWETLRQLPEAAFLGLALPRLLLRLPYGKDTSPLEQFAFEELPEKAPHEAYLWGNPAFACVYLLAEAFSRRGWEMYPGLVQEIDNLPLHVRRGDDEEVAQPCAEVGLIDRAVAAIFNRGLMPLRSVQNRDVVYVPQFQSVAQPAKPLAGRWR